MNIDEYPNLLIVTKLVEPIDISIKNINGIRKHLRSDLEELFIQGAFVLAVSRIEVMLSDVLKYYLICFPQKLSTDFRFDKGEFLENQFTFLETAVDKYLYNLFYKPLGDYLNKFLQHLSIEWNDFQESLGNDLQTIKNNRNLLLHTGNAVQADNDGPIDYDYVVQSIDKILCFEEELKKRITEKYKEYTKINANKKLWQFMFHTPLLLYDNYWYYDESTDRITGLKRNKYESDLASSEKMLLDLWRSQFNSSSIESFKMRHFDDNNREKVMFFMFIARDFSFE